MKAFAARPQDWIDIEGIVIRQSGRLDWTYVYDNLAPLAELKQNPEIVAQLRGIERKFAGPARSDPA